MDKLKASLGSFLRTLGDLMILNLLWLVCSLPVVTVGPATSALCRVLIKLAREEPVSTAGGFFEGFKSEFKKTLALGLLGLVGLVLAAGDFYFAVQQEGGMRTLFLGVSVIVSAVVLGYWAWVFALQACYENSLSATIKNALSLAFVEPKKTVLIWIGFAVPIVCFLFLPEEAVIYLGWAYILFAVSAPAWFAARQQVKVFARFDEEDDGVEEVEAEEIYDPGDDE